MKNIANLNGVKALSKNEQKSIHGGIIDPCGFLRCLGGAPCCNGKCVYGL